MGQACAKTQGHETAQFQSVCVHAHGVWRGMEELERQAVWVGRTFGLDLKCSGKKWKGFSSGNGVSSYTCFGKDALAAVWKMGRMGRLAGRPSVRR